jgi:hypothetical protein
MKEKIFALLLVVLAFAGCATNQPGGRADLLGFLSDGVTTKKEALLNLGQPSGTFEGRKILTYRIGFNSHNNGFYVVQRPPGTGKDGEYSTWEGARYSLVLVFDTQNLLRRNSLVEVAK